MSFIGKSGFAVNNFFFFFYLQLKEGYDDEESTKEVFEALQESSLTDVSILGNNFKYKDMILLKHFHSLKLIHERVVLPCAAINGFTSMVDTIIEISGNLSLEQLLDLQSGAENVKYNTLLKSAGVAV